MPIHGGGCERKENKRPSFDERFSLLAADWCD
jgi:hypothetical protein